MTFRSSDHSLARGPSILADLGDIVRVDVGLQKGFEGVVTGTWRRPDGHPMCKVRRWEDGVELTFLAGILTVIARAP